MAVPKPQRASIHRRLTATAVASLADLDAALAADPVDQAAVDAAQASLDAAEAELEAAQTAQAPLQAAYVQANRAWVRAAQADKRAAVADRLAERPRPPWPSSRVADNSGTREGASPDQAAHPRRRGAEPAPVDS